MGKLSNCEAGSSAERIKPIQLRLYEHMCKVLLYDAGMARPHNVPQFLNARCEFDAELAGGMQVMHISAASEINNMLLPSLEMLRARPILCLHASHSACNAFHLNVFHLGTHQIGEYSSCITTAQSPLVHARKAPLLCCAQALTLM